jgi:arabinofuranosyltransferase
MIHESPPTECIFLMKPLLFPSNATSTTRILYFFCVAFILLYGSWHIHCYFFLTDDAYITFRYLHNFLQGDGLVFNAGESVEGYSNFLWLLLLVPLTFCGVSPEISAPFLSILLTFLLLFFFVRFASQYLKLPLFSFLLLFGLLFLLSQRTFVVFATSGLETRLFSFLVFLSLSAFWKESHSLENLPRFNLAGFAMALATLTRPEGMALSASLLSVRLFQRWRLNRKYLQDLTFYVWLLIPIALHLLFRRWYYGEWLPNTYYAKVISESRFSYGFLYLRGFALEHALFFVLPFVSMGILHALKRRDLLLYGLFFALFFPYLYFLSYQGGDHFEYRPLDVLLPFLTLFTLEGLVYAFQKLSLSNLRLAQIFIGLCILLLSFLAFIPGYLIHLQLESGNYEGIQIPSIALQLQKWYPPSAIPLFIKKHDALQAKLIERFIGVKQEEHRKFWQKQKRSAQKLQEAIQQGKIQNNPRMSLECVGVIPYYSKLPTLDVLGLTDSFVAKLPQDPSQKSFFLAHEKRAPFSYLQQREVPLVSVHATKLFYSKSLAVFRYQSQEKCYYAQIHPEEYFIFYSTLPDLEALRPYFHPEVPLGLLKDLHSPELFSFPAPLSPYDSPALTDASGIVNGSFESGDLRGWSAFGDAMKFQPTYGNSIETRYLDQEVGQHGLYWIGTYEATNKNKIIERYATQGNTPRGTLTSHPFILNKNYLHFRMGGGIYDAELNPVYVEILIEKISCFFLTNPYPTEEMRALQVDVREWRGHSAQIRIVDDSRNRWGHLNVDDFRLAD